MTVVCRIALTFGMLVLSAGMHSIAETIEFGDVRNAIAEVSPGDEGYMVKVSFKGVGIFSPLKNRQVNLSLAKGYAMRAIARTMPLGKDERLICSGGTVAGKMNGEAFSAICEIASVKRVAKVVDKGEKDDGGKGSGSKEEAGAADAGQPSGDVDASFLAGVDVSDMPLLNYVNARRQEIVILWQEWRCQIDSVPLDNRGEEQLAGIEDDISKSLDVDEAVRRLKLDVHMMSDDIQIIHDLMTGIKTDLGHRIDARLREIALAMGFSADPERAKLGLAEVKERFVDFSEGITRQ